MCQTVAWWQGGQGPECLPHIQCPFLQNVLGTPLPRSGYHTPAKNTASQIPAPLPCPPLPSGNSLVLGRGAHHRAGELLAVTDERLAV